MVDSIYMEAFGSKEIYYLNLESLIVLIIHKYCDSDNVLLQIGLLEEKLEDFAFAVDFSKISHTVLNGVPSRASLSIWPVIVTEDVVVSGLCSVTRQIIKSSENSKVQKLLGFREACLIACSESSVWTKFCEVDIINTIKQFVSKRDDLVEGTTLSLPEDICRFEYHMSQPIRMHNVYKVAREINKNKDISASIPIDQLNITHSFSEGPFMTLADCILYPCFHVFFSYIKPSLLEDKLPLTFAWYTSMKEALSGVDVAIPPLPYMNVQLVEPAFTKHSLYKSDPNRYKPEKRLFTKQYDIDQSLDIIKKSSINISNDLIPYGAEVVFDWKTVPLLANPVGGALPEKRADRKCEQLENLAKAVIKLTNGESLTIVDFCSGSGHLGILLACLLPTCTIILVENKEKSLKRASERIKMLNLSNVVVLQSNLDYFNAKFDIGVTLHACGTATDLVLRNCIRNKAHFVCCPCCYGAIKNCHYITYPQSQQFQRLNLDYKGYLNLAHAADQTHDAKNVKTEQGFYCMDVIDTDRKLYAESCGYVVNLGKLQPETCTNKNNLLIGIYKESYTVSTADVW